MHHAEPVDPAGFARFPELRYPAVPHEAYIPEGAEPPPPPEDYSPGPAIAVDWISGLPELRWLDLECVGADLRPLAGHPRLRTVLAAHCRIKELPTESMPALREFLAPFSDCPDAEVERMRRLHAGARIRTTPRDVLLDCIGTATCLRLRTGASCHPHPSDRVVYATNDRSEICALLDLLKPRGGYEHNWSIPGCDHGVMQFLDANGALLAEVGMIGTGTLRSYQAWGTTPSFLGSEEKAAALGEWLAARGLQILDWSSSS